jgi:hypothetical protein
MSMWPRISELALACWLVLAPMILGHADDSLHKIEDATYGVLVAVLALMSFVPRFRRAHLGIVAVATWMLVRGYFLSPTPPPAWAQNHLLVGLTLLMLAILPAEASKPPVAWRGSPRTGEA